ncbi:MAG: hypothetical protein Kow0047_21830 [Anaerolineae bacterium]
MNEPIRCPNPECGHVNRPGANFCSQCGAPLKGLAPPPRAFGQPDQPPRVEGKRWQRRPGEIACRIRSEDLPSGRERELIIEEGTQAVILKEGRVVAQQGPGIYPLSVSSGPLGFFRRGGEVIALLVDSGEIPLRFELVDLWTQDPLRLNATCQLVVQVTDPARFVRNLLKDRRTFTVNDLRDLLYPEVRDAAQAYVGDYTMSRLEADLTRRREDFGVDLQELLRPSLEQNGLALRRVQMFDLRHPRFDELKKQEEELFLGPKELHNRQRLFDLYTQEQLQQIAEEEAEVAHFELRAQVWDRMRRAVLQDRINQATTDEEWEKFVAEADKRRLLREDELQQFREALRWKAEDRQAERAHAVAMAELRREFELKGARLAREYEHDRERLRYELALAEQETLGRLEIRRKQVEMELQLEEMEAAHRRRQQELDAIAAREAALRQAQTDNEIALARARTQVEIEQLEREQDRLDAELGILLLEKMKAVKRRDEEERRRIEFEDWYRRQKAELEIEERRLEMQLRAQAQAHEQEMARKQQMAELSTEALIALSDRERGELLAELKRMEILKGYSEEQLLVMLAEKRPEVIEAIKVKYQALAEGRLSAAEAEKWRALAEQQAKHMEELRRQMQEQMDRQERMAREAAERQERITGKALDSATDIAKAFAQKGDGGTTVVFPPGGGAATIGPSGATTGTPGGEVQVCPRCRVKSPVGEQYCSNCGYKFYEA